MVDELQVVKMGYLTKSPPQSNSSISFKNWRRRWFVLLDSRKTYPLAPRSLRLEYYVDERTSERKGVIDLSDVSAIEKLDRDIRGHRHLFNLITDRRCYHLSADSEEERKQWVRVLKSITSDAKSPPLPPSYDPDETLAKPTVISGGSAEGFTMPGQKRGNVAAAGAPTYSVVQKPMTGPKKQVKSLTYDEEWDSDDDTAGPRSVQSSLVRGFMDDEHLVLDKDKSMAASSFTPGSAPSGLKLGMQPVHFGGGVGLEVEDGLPEYQNLGGDGIEDGIDDYSEVANDETEDNIPDYRNLRYDGKPLGCEDGIPEYTNLGPDGQPYLGAKTYSGSSVDHAYIGGQLHQHVLGTDDGIPEYANLDENGMPIGGAPERSIEYVQVDHSTNQPTVRQQLPPVPAHGEQKRFSYQFAQPSFHAPVTRAMSYEEPRQNPHATSSNRIPPPLPGEPSSAPHNKVKRVPTDELRNSLNRSGGVPGRVMQDHGRPKSSSDIVHSSGGFMQTNPGARVHSIGQTGPPPPRDPPQVDGNYVMHSCAKPRPPVPSKSQGSPVKPSDIARHGHGGSFKHKPAPAPRPYRAS